MIYDMPIDQTAPIEEVRYFAAPIRKLGAPVTVPPAYVFTAQDYTTCAKQIVALFNKGFQWGELVTMMQMAMNFMRTKSPNIAAADLRTGVAAILDDVISQTESSNLPEEFAAPIFEGLIPPTLNWLIPDNYQTVFFPVKTPGKATAAEMASFVENSVNAFSGGFQWSDLTTVAINTIQFVQSFSGYAVSDRQALATNVLDQVIAKVNFPIVPNFIADPIVIKILNPYVVELVNLVNNLESQVQGM